MIKEYFIQSPEYQDYIDNKEELLTDSLILVEDMEKLITQEHEYQFVPSGGEEGQVLMKTKDGYKWVNIRELIDNI